MGGVVFEALTYKVFEASGKTASLEKASRTLARPVETFYKGDCFGPAQENIDIATTNIPQNSGLIMIRLILTKIHCKNRREKNGRDCFSWIAISTF